MVIAYGAANWDPYRAEHLGALDRIKKRVRVFVMVRKINGKHRMKGGKGRYTRITGTNRPGKK